MESSVELMNPATGEYVLFSSTEAETNGDYIQGVSTFPPTLAVPTYHEHPRQEEQLDVVSGTVLVRIEGKLQVAGPGAHVVIPAGVAHEISNAGAEPAQVVWRFHPALRTGDFLKASLAHAGSTRAGRWSRLRNRVAVASEFSDVYRKATWPWIVQRPVLAVLSRLTNRPARKGMGSFVRGRSGRARTLAGNRLGCTS